jgi:hypothetical protein
MSRVIEKAITAEFLDTAEGVVLELTNRTEHTLTSVEILTIFLKDDETPGGPSRAHIRFDAIKQMRPNNKAVPSHRTLIDGKPVARNLDQLERLKVISSGLKPYVLDISWEDPDGKMGYQRIPVGH